MFASTKLTIFLSVLSGISSVSGHSAFFHPSMWGFNVTDKDFSYDNRPVAPLRDKTFSEWWFHNHLSFPPKAGDLFSLPAGGVATAEIACNKGATSFFASSEGGDIREPQNPNNPCPNSPTIAFHTHGLDELEGCALAIAYKDDVSQVQPEDFTVFSVNHTCVWTRFTEFAVPARMPACPPGGCICSFFWIHSPKGGGEENYMNGFRCNVTDPISNVPLAKSKVARRCGADPENGKTQSVPGNCTYGAKQPLYWIQAERNNMFEGAQSPPVYNDLYNFLDGAQEDIFEDSYVSLVDPAPNAPVPVLRQIDTSRTGNTTTLPTSAPPSSPSGTTSTTGLPVPTFLPSKACRRKSFPSTSSSSSTLRRRGQEGPVEGLFARTSPGRRLLRMSRRSRKLHPADTRRLWHMW